MLSLYAHGVQAMHEAQVKKLLEEKNHFEKKCYELQLQKLNQNFSEKVTRNSFVTHTLTLTCNKSREEREEVVC